MSNSRSKSRKGRIESKAFFKSTKTIPDRPPEAQPDEYRYWDRSNAYNQPRTLDFLASIRQLLDIYSSADGRPR